MKSNKILALTSLALAMGLSQSANATVFSFDPSGTGTPTYFGDSFDQAPGTALALGGNAAVQNFIAGAGPTSFDLLYQANLNSIQLGGGNTFTNGTGGYFFNFTAKFGETVTAALPLGTGGIASFGLTTTTPSASNFFNMYASPSLSNNLTGAGFGTVGAPIFSAHAVAEASSSYSTTSAGPVLLDQFGGDNWGGQLTTTGGGLTQLTLVVDTVNSLFFPSLTTGDTIQLAFNTSQVNPFTTTDPSQAMFNGAIPAIGTINGASPAYLAANGGGTFGADFMFLADGNSSLRVPEPGSLSLLSLGLIGMGARSLRRNKKS